MSIKLSVEVYDWANTPLFSGIYIEDGLNDMSMNNDLWQAITRVPKKGYIVWGYATNDGVIGKKKISCVKNYKDDVSVDGSYVLTEKGLGEKIYENREEFDSTIVRNIHSAIKFLYEKEFFYIIKVSKIGSAVITHDVAYFERIS